MNPTIAVFLVVLIGSASLCAAAAWSTGGFADFASSQIEKSEFYIDAPDDASIKLCVVRG